MKPMAVPDNYLLELLDVDPRAALCLVPVQLHAQEVLHETGMPALSAYFPVSGVISLISTMKNGASAEVALVGREGMVGLAGGVGSPEGSKTAVGPEPRLGFKVATGG